MFQSFNRIIFPNKKKIANSFTTKFIAPLLVMAKCDSDLHESLDFMHRLILEKKTRGKLPHDSYCTPSNPVIMLHNTVL